MYNDPFHFIPWTDIDTLDSPIICFLTVEDVQEFAECNCGGRLTDAELEGLYYAFMETLDGAYMHDAISQVRPRPRPGREQA